MKKMPVAKEAMMEEMSDDTEPKAMAVEIDATEVPDISDVIDDLSHIQSDLVKIKKAQGAVGPTPPKSIAELRNNIQERNKFKPEE